MLPIPISQLLETNLIEEERLELKRGFNPEDVMHTMCAFANDFNNWGGGYIIIGIHDKTKEVIGVNPSEIDTILKKMIGLSNKIHYPYFPVVEPIIYKNKTVLVIACPGGPARPYKAPTSLGKNSEYKYYIRRNSSTVIAKHEDEKELIGMSNQIPYDDQINHKASINDLNLHLIKQYLKEINSNLDPEILKFEELCKSLNIVDGPKEYLKPKNIGLLLFFNKS
ncbi:AlbA family DNA-binding domain-containing protein [Methanococcus vannielii]|uniref:AlbA family DNA-binding domain-containing protein n=1 Tax=Methanococcus vannielii TaxID=2187 RepID=UPI0000F0AE0A|nr:RNA-binding domain-containing protein [Methanococcus vannielii]